MGPKWWFITIVLITVIGSPGCATPPPSSQTDSYRPYVAPYQSSITPKAPPPLSHVPEFRPTLSQPKPLSPVPVLTPTPNIPTPPCLPRR
jgi:hypothetical protein